MAEVAVAATEPAAAPSSAGTAGPEPQTGEASAAASSSAPAQAQAPAPPAPSPMPTTLEYKKQQALVRNLIMKRIEIDKKLAALEDSIANKEQMYLDATPNGNIITGYDHYMKSSGGAAAQRRKTGLGEQNKVFTRSSVSYRPNASDSATTPGSTPAASHAPTPLSTTFRDGPGASGSNHATPTSATAPSTKGGNKKRKHDEESEDESQAGGTKKRTNFGAARR